MKIIAVIKASNISVHFPNRFKVKINGKHPLDFLVERLKNSTTLDEIILATSTDDSDSDLANFATEIGISVYRGDYEDSLGRVHGAAKQAQGDIIVKVLGNYPLVDPWAIDELIQNFIRQNVDYAFNEHYKGIMHGLGVEVFSYEIINWLHREIASPAQRRFGTNILKEILPKERIFAQPVASSRPKYRATLAVPNDIELINQIVGECDKLDQEGIAHYLDTHPILVTYAEQNIVGAKEVGLEKILLFPEKVHTLIRNCGKLDFSYPISVELSLTNRCNLDCTWCSDSDLRKRSQADIDYSALELLFSDLAKNGTKGIVIEGGGEPTLYKRFADVVQLAKKEKLALGLITNGTKSISSELVPCFEWIRFSLDASTQQQYRSAKGADCFHKVIGNIEKISHFRRSAATTIGVGYVLTKNNFEGLEELIINLKKINVDYIQIRPVIDHPELLPDSLDVEYLRKYATRNFSVNIHNMDENVIQGNFNLPCFSHSFSSVIAANGDVFLCGRLNKYDWVKPIGNLNHNEFSEIWKGDERKTQWAAVNDKDFCRRWCPECRLTKYNKLIHQTLLLKTGNFI